MDEMLTKLEHMLVGLKQMKINVVFTWFPKIDKNEILKAIEESPKFKIEGNAVMLKSENEIYEEELQKDILKELMGEKDILDNFDDEIELVEIPLDENIDKNIWDNHKELIQSSNEIIKEGIQDIEIVEDITIEEGLTEAAASVVKTEVEEEKEIKEKEVIRVKDTSLLKGDEIKYEELVRLIKEYSEKTLNKLLVSDEHTFEMEEKAIKTFYESKYNVRIKESGFSGENSNIYSLINRKKGVEGAYLVICTVLTEDILDYVLENYEDEVVYFCPLNGSEVRFEIGLNEFFLKDTDAILDKYLEHYEVKDECDFNIKKVEVVVGR